MQAYCQQIGRYDGKCQLTEIWLNDPVKIQTDIYKLYLVYTTALLHHFYLHRCKVKRFKTNSVSTQALLE